MTSISFAGRFGKTLPPPLFVAPRGQQASRGAGWRAWTRCWWLLATLAGGFSLGCGVEAHFHVDAGPQGGSRAAGSSGGGETVGGSSGSAGNGGSPSAGSGGRGNQMEPASGGSSGGQPTEPGTAGGGGSGDGGNAGSAAGAGSGGNAGNGSNPSEPPAPPSDPNAGVMIDGRFVPKDRAVVFIHVGHSDMAGRADRPASLRAFFTDTDPQLWTYSDDGTFRLAREPTAGDNGSQGKGGPGMALLKTALADAPEVFFISVGHGHSGAVGGYCPNFRRGKLIWPTFMNAARELKGKVTFGGLFTMFGITEYHVPNGPAQVGDCIVGLAAEIREELDAPDMPLMVGDWNMGGTGIYSPTGEYGRAARPELSRIPERDPRAALIPTAGLPMQDDRHLNLEGHKNWAERALGIMGEKAWLPWATP